MHSDYSDPPIPSTEAPQDTIDAAVTPVDDRVLIVPDTSEATQAPGSAIVLVSSTSMIYTGTVRSVGAGKVVPQAPDQRYPMNVKVGDRVLFQRTHGTELRVNGVRCVLISEAFVLAVLDPTALVDVVPTDAP